MRAIIDIPDDDFNAIRCEALYYIGHDRLDVSVTNAFQNCKIIPDDCGDLIDRDELTGELWWAEECPHVHLDEHGAEIWKAINKAPTVVPKYRGNKE